MVDITEELMEHLYREEKALMEDVEWEQDDQNNARYFTRTKATCVETGEVLTVCGEKWEMGHSFVLRYQNQPIRLWDFNQHHDGIDGGHKHKYTAGEFRKGDPYSVDDVSTSDVNQALNDFLDECNIQAGDATIDKITGLNYYE